jgi:Spy/CpxP family protein refolding chaperone
MERTRSLQARKYWLLLGVALAPACAGGQGNPPPTAPAPAAPVASAPAAMTPPATPAPTPAPAASTEAPPAAPPQAAAEEHHHPHGMLDLLMMGLHGIELKPEQKSAVDGIQSDLQKVEQQHEQPRQQLVSDLADGVAAGKIDHKKTDADVAALLKAVQASQASVQDAFNRLHKTLDAAQRKQLVETLRAHGKEMHEHMMDGAHDHDHDKGGDHDAHGMGKGPGHGMGEGHGMADGHGMGEGGALHMLGEELALTPEQREKLRAKLEPQMKAKMAAMKQKMEAGEKHMKAIADAFEGEKFDAKQAGVGAMVPDMIKTMVSDRVAFVETVLAVLTPDQRSKFAAHIRAHAADAD